MNDSRTSIFYTSHLKYEASIFDSIIVYVKETGSTMKTALKLAQAGAKEGTVVLTDCQRKGRGRRGNEWFSITGGSLTFSVILKGSELFRDVMAAASVAVMRALKIRTGLAVAVKWPNDILIRRKKIAGLIIEQYPPVNGDFILILGIGLNVNLTLKDFPEPLKSTATSIFLETGVPVPPAVILRDIVGEFTKTYHAIGSPEGLDAILAEYNWDMELTGRRIVVKDEERIMEGVAGILEPGGGLSIMTHKGEREIIYSGEVVTW